MIAGCNPGYTLASESGGPATQMGSVYDFTLNDVDGKPLPLNQFRGKVLLLVNTASFCGNTPQYEQLQTMYERYHAQGFEILAFPANNFGRQEPGTNEEIKKFCYTKYSLTFPLFSKISVKGDDKHPLYRYLTERSPFPGEVEWNFQKYLVDRTGRIIARYHHRTKPLSDEIVQDVERTLSNN
ncbi:MAG: glutathione peroxidase [Nitrospiraceae bacterium]